MNLPFDPPDDAAWTLTGAAEINGDHGYVSAPNALFLFARRLPGGSITFSRSVATKTVTPGEPLPIYMLVKGDASNTIQLRLTLDDGVAAQTYTLTVPAGLGFLPWEPGTYTPASATLTITFNTPAPASLPGGSLGIGGSWVVDDLRLGSAEDEDDVTKRREIREAALASIRTVTTANGYAVDIGSVVAGSAAEREIEAWPHVQIQHGEETKEIGALQRKRCVVSLTVDVFCQDDGNGNAEDQCDDVCGEIEKALELYESGRFLGLAYVSNVFVSAINPMEMPESVARTLRLWSMTVDVTYSHERRNP